MRDRKLRERTDKTFRSGRLAVAAV